MLPIRVGVQAQPTTGDTWRELATRVESLGFDRLLVADHPGSGPAPFVALATAAAVTQRVRLGTYVANAGVWEPLALASEVATLDRLSSGRAVLGIGAGHTPAEWTMRGMSYPSADNRIGRLIEVADVTVRLLRGETVSFDGRYLTVEEATLGPLADTSLEVPLLVGGNGPRVLGYAAGKASTVAMSGLGRTLDDGHRHEALWSGEAIDSRVRTIRRAASAAGRSPVVEALVQQVTVTTDRNAAAREFADDVPGLSTDDVLQAPFVWLGTVEQIAAQIRHHRDRWGIDSYVVRAEAIDHASDVLDAL